MIYFRFESEWNFIAQGHGRYAQSVEYVCVCHRERERARALSTEIPCGARAFLPPKKSGESRRATRFSLSAARGPIRTLERLLRSRDQHECVRTHVETGIRSVWHFRETPIGTGGRASTPCVPRRAVRARCRPSEIKPVVIP